MTRPAGSTLIRSAKQCALVLEGNTIRLRLMAERANSKSPVHVDWVRFTVLRRNTSRSIVDKWFGGVHSEAGLWDCEARAKRLSQELAKLPDCDNDAAAQALELAHECARALGDDFTVAPEPRKGHDFYRFRFCIERNGQEVGWVGFQASSDSPRQAAQARTLHVNLYGAACTFGADRWNHRLADLVDARSGTLTRCDLALDFFDGIEGGIERFDAEYDAGLMDVNGKRPKCNHLGDWSRNSLGGRSLYIGSKEAGKQTNLYEKGHQLFGVEVGSPWLRAELRYGNKLRELPTDMLRRPADFFADASDWHAALLRECDAAYEAEEAIVKAKGRLAIETVQAEVARNAAWIERTAAASIGTLLRFMDTDDILDLVMTNKRPGRLKKFSDAELSLAYREVLERIKPVESASPALA